MISSNYSSLILFSKQDHIDKLEVSLQKLTARGAVFRQRSEISPAAENRDALLAGGSKPRVFGETDETRSLDNKGVLQLQREKLNGTP